MRRKLRDLQQGLGLVTRHLSQWRKSNLLDLLDLDFVLDFVLEVCLDVVEVHFDDVGLFEVE